MQKYVTNMLDEAVEYLVKLWGTDKLPIPERHGGPVHETGSNASDTEVSHSRKE